MRPHLTAVVAAGLLLAVPAVVHAGLYYSGEEIAELPSQWRGYLIDQRQLRTIAVKPTDANPAGPARKRYEDEAAKLAQGAERRQAQPRRDRRPRGAVRSARRHGQGAGSLAAGPARHPQNFRLAANLGTAWQVSGDLDQAAACLEQSADLAPGKYQRAEKLHLKLVRLRAASRATPGTSTTCSASATSAPTASTRSVGSTTRSARRCPTTPPPWCSSWGCGCRPTADCSGRWRELAAVTGDVTTAAAILDGCVTEFGLRNPELRRHRQTLRDAADALSPATTPTPSRPTTPVPSRSSRSRRGRWSTRSTWPTCRRSTPRASTCCRGPSSPRRSWTASSIRVFRTISRNWTASRFN